VGEQEDEEEELIEEVKILNDLGLLGSCFVQRTWFKYCHGSGVFSLYHVSQFHVSTVVPRSTLHHWSTPHRCHPTYTINSYIQYQLSSILQFFLHTRCFPHRDKYTLKRWPLSPDPYRIIPVFFPLFQQKQAANIFYQKNY
jgi:hypothetical protein